MYSFSPIIDISQSHEGFFVVLAICVIVTLWVTAISDEGRPAALLGTIVSCVVLTIAYNSSYVDQRAPVNEQVVGTLVGMQSEGRNAQSGKTRADHHVQYVVYAVPAGQIMFDAHVGTAYPQSVILYKN